MSASKADFIAMADRLRPIARQMHQLHETDPMRKLFDDMLTAVCDAFASQNRKFRRSTFEGYVHGTCGPNGGEVK
jgi:hypothetical protein